MTSANVEIYVQHYDDTIDLGMDDDIRDYNLPHAEQSARTYEGQEVTLSSE